MIKSSAVSHGEEVTSALDESPAGPPVAQAKAKKRLRAIHDDYFDFVWRTVRRLGLTADESDDAAQQVFLVIAKRIDDIVPARERSFVFGTAMRIAAEVRRARVRAPVPIGDASDAARDSAPDAEELVDERRARAMLDRVLDAMEIDLRAVFVLYELEELTMAEIAELLDIPPGTVASRLRRARQVFRERAAASKSEASKEGGTR